jgi:hypothetical protein
MSDQTHPRPTHPTPTHPSRPTGLLGRLRARIAERERNRRLSGRNRVVDRVKMLGPAWHIVDYHPEDPDFLAIGPGGIFQVTVADIGSARVEIAGDVVQIGGHRPPYVALARRDAARISEQMTAAAGRRIPVVPVVAFLGRGQVVYYGKPPEGVVVTTYGDLGRALNAHGNRIRESTLQKLLVVANRVDSGTVGQYL